MAESKKLETIIYCLGPVGGIENPVISPELTYESKSDFTKTGYDRYIEEANNAIKYQFRILNYFLNSAKPEVEDPVSFIDEETEENTMAAIVAMKQQWREMFKEHQKELRESRGKPCQVVNLPSEDSGSSSPKIRKIDPGPTSAEGAVGGSAEPHRLPASVFSYKTKDFVHVLKTEYLKLKAKMGNALECMTAEGPVRDLKGFSLFYMQKLARWKYALKTLTVLVSDLKSTLDGLDLETDERKENEVRLSDWIFFDDGEKDKKYHHRLLIPVEIAGSFEEISELMCKQLRRFGKIRQSLKAKLPSESEVFELKLVKWQNAILHPGQAFKPRKSIDSADTLFNVDDMPEETT